MTWPLFGWLVEICCGGAFGAHQQNLLHVFIKTEDSSAAKVSRVQGAQRLLLIILFGSDSFIIFLFTYIFLFIYILIILKWCARKNDHVDVCFEFWRVFHPAVQFSNNRFYTPCGMSRVVYISACLSTGLLSQWMLHWWRVNGSTARETFLAPNHQLLVRCCTSGKYRFSRLRFWPDQESNPTCQLSRPGINQLCHLAGVKPSHVICCIPMSCFAGGAVLFARRLNVESSWEEIPRRCQLHPDRLVSPLAWGST